MREPIYSPGAGHLPPELAGRDGIQSDWEQMLNAVSVEGRKRSIDQVITGPRGVGKSVLLTRLADLATNVGYDVIRIPGNQDTSLVTAITDETSLRTSGRWAKAKELLSEVSSLGISAAGFGVQVGRDATAAASPAATASPGRLAAVLADLATEGRKDKANGLVLSIDELQMCRQADIRLLGSVLNQLNTVHRDAPVVFVGAGLPNTRGRLVGPDANHPFISNPERLFRFGSIGSLSEAAAATALVRPAQHVGVAWEPDAITAVINASGCYPAHLQVYAAAAWNQGSATEPVTLDHVLTSAVAATREIEKQYLGPRWNGLTEQQRAYITALALCGGEATSAEVAAVLGTTVKAISLRRDDLIGRGEIYDPAWGRVALSMPAMQDYALRRYPATVEDSTDGRLITPAQMMRNHAEWRDAKPRIDPAELSFAPPPAQLDDRPLNFDQINQGLAPPAIPDTSRDTGHRGPTLH